MQMNTGQEKFLVDPLTPEERCIVGSVGISSLPWANDRADGSNAPNPIPIQNVVTKEGDPNRPKEKEEITVD